MKGGVAQETRAGNKFFHQSKRTIKTNFVISSGAKQYGFYLTKKLIASSSLEEFKSPSSLNMTFKTLNRVIRVLMSCH